MSGKTILVTGSSTGIGRSIAEYFQYKGWNVAATMRKPEAVDKEFSELPNIRCLPLDVLDEDSIRQAIAETIATFGSIDVIVNNAGYGLVGPFETTTREQIEKQFDTNLFGVMNVTRAILPYFRERRAGVIINIASAGGRMTWPLHTLYHGTKWALEGFTEGLQYELRPFNIRVRIVEPGSIRTDFFGRSQEIAFSSELAVYDEYVNRVVPNLQKAGADAPGPEVVAPVVYQAATDRSWRLRYQAGRAGGTVMFLRRVLPTGLFNGIVRMVTERKADRLRRYRAED
jgi:NAD(P)-dependent dehydrogenase (short-subunit alcohol dehydrogenase family)